MASQGYGYASRLVGSDPLNRKANTLAVDEDGYDELQLADRDVCRIDEDGMFEIYDSRFKEYIASSLLVTSVL